MADLMGGQKFGRLRVIRRDVDWRSPTNNKPKAQYLCECECGSFKVICGASLTRGLTKSCGCLQAEKAAISTRSRTKHGHAGKNETREYRTWAAMIKRCTRPGNHNFKNYGARGIAVCDRWREDFTAFLADMGPRPAGRTLDRIDVNGNYEPGNCRWATPKEQANNKRPRHD